MESTNNTDLIDTYFTFVLKTDKFSGEYSTPEFKLSGIPWKIKICKRSANGDDVIDAMLECSPTFESNALDWSCEAQATVKLPSSEIVQQPFEKKIPNTKFERGLQSHGLVPFITWSDLKQYEQNEEVHFEIHLSANPVKFFTPSEIDQARVKFRFTVANISKLDLQKSSEVTVRGNNWYVYAQKRDEHLGIYLVDKRISQSENWTWKVKCSFKLLSFSRDIQPIVKSINKTFNHKGEDWGYPKFITWDELNKKTNNYILQNKAIFEIDLEVEPAKPSWNFESMQSEIGILECSICLQSVIGHEPTTTKCGHMFCGPCIKRTIEEREKCPLCNIGANLLDLRPIYL